MGCLLTTLPALVKDSSEPEGGLPPGSRSIACLELTGALDEVLMDAWDKDTRSTFNGGCGVGPRHAAWHEATDMACNSMAALHCCAGCVHLCTNGVQPSPR